MNTYLQRIWKWVQGLFRRSPKHYYLLLWYRNQYPFPIRSFQTKKEAQHALDAMPDPYPYVYYEYQGDEYPAVAHAHDVPKNEIRVGVWGHYLNG